MADSIFMGMRGRQVAAVLGQMGAVLGQMGAGGRAPYTHEKEGVLFLLYLGWGVFSSCQEGA